jgi:very-short-patch-repair endonuclease
VVDFYCHELALAVEVDGGHRFEPENDIADRQRTEWLEARGLRVLRFTNSEVLRQADSLLEQILSVIEDLQRSPSPGYRHPLPQGEGIEDAPLQSSRE